MKEEYLLVDAAEDAPRPRDRGRGARLPLVVPRMAGRGDRPSAGGHRGGAGPLWSSTNILIPDSRTELADLVRRPARELSDFRPPGGIDGG